MFWVFFFPEGGSLLSIEDPSEQAFINSYIQVFKDNFDAFWIGLYKTHRGMLTCIVCSIMTTTFLEYSVIAHATLRSIQRVNLITKEQRVFDMKLNHPYNSVKHPNACHNKLVKKYYSVFWSVSLSLFDFLVSSASNYLYCQLLG